MASLTPDPLIKFNYTRRDYQEKLQTLRNGVYPTPSASNLSKVLLSDFTEDIISSLSGKKVLFQRAVKSPSKSRGRSRIRSEAAIGHDHYHLDNTQSEQLDFILACLRRWLPPEGECFGISLPCTDDIVSNVEQSLYGTSDDSDEDENLPPVKKQCHFGKYFTGALDTLLYQLCSKMQPENTFGNGEGKELVVAIGNLVTITDKRAECLLSTVKGGTTVKGRTTVTVDVEWDDGTTGEFISNGDAEILIDKCAAFAFEVKNENSLGESQLAVHLMIRAALQNIPVMGIVVSGNKHRLIRVDESPDAFTVNELDKYWLSDRSSLIDFVSMLFHVLRGTTSDGGASTSSRQDVPTSSTASLHSEL